MTYTTEELDLSTCSCPNGTLSHVGFQDENIFNGMKYYIVKFDAGQGIRDVFIKVATDPAYWGMLEREKRLHAKAHAASSRVIPLIDVQLRQGNKAVPCIATALAYGSLHDNLDLYGTPERATILIAACEGLAELHNAGVVHRDVSPENIMMVGDLEARLFDFGHAALVGEWCDPRDYAPGYEPPENRRARAKAEGVTAAPAEDVYAMALTIGRVMGDGIGSELATVVDQNQLRNPKKRPGLAPMIKRLRRYARVQECALVGR